MAVRKVLGIAAAFLAGLAGCAGSGPTPEQEAAAAAVQETIEDILSTPLESQDYVETQRCLSTFSYNSVEILDDRNVLFKGVGDRYWINQLRQRCIGLRRHSTPVFRLRDSQVCDMDTFQGVDNMFGMWSRATATCSLGTFTPISREQADAIRATLREARTR